MKLAKGDDPTEVARPESSRLAPAERVEQKAKPVKLLKSDSVEDAAVCVFSAALDHFEANIPVFLGAQSAESVHQMRVALRRLRAAMGLFRGALSGETLETARDRARSLGSTLGDARNRDVFHDMLSQGPGPALGGDDPSLRALLDALERRRAVAYRVARDAVGGKETEVFLADFRKTIASRDWEPAPGAADEGSAVDFAREALTRLRKRVLKKSKNLAERSAGGTPSGAHRAQEGALRRRVFRKPLRQARGGGFFRDARQNAGPARRLQRHGDGWPPARRHRPRRRGDAARLGLCARLVRAFGAGRR